MDTTFDIQTANGTVLRAQAKKLGIDLTNAPTGDTEALRRFVMEELAKLNSSMTPIQAENPPADPQLNTTVTEPEQPPPTDSQANTEKKSRKLKLKGKSGSYTDFFNGVLTRFSPDQLVDFDEELLHTGRFEEVEE